ncbi:hypothetical protein BKA70DRAFT_1396283 [Coprinopsis sp. MPI-PUGE-AT-0042]|nr:hypothetical protein BKA70DRAFT_1396283 [Coprinopsis sp. MPI-PUGE-AT-0042]
MPSPKPVHPCLPEEFIRKLKEDPSTLFERSYILESFFEKFRSGALKLGKDRTPMEIPMDTPAPEASPFRSLVRHFPAAFRKLDDMNVRCNSFCAEDKETFLHLAAAKGDLPLAYEVVRMGINLDHQDRNGVTALFLAVLKVAALSMTVDVIDNYPNKNPFPIPEEFQTTQPTREDDIPFQSAVQRSQYSSLLAKTNAVATRPLRPCPCWSGKFLRDCHDDGVDHPWPDHFLCGCGRRKTFSNCCGRRGIKVVERWDPEDKWIMPFTKKEVVTDTQSMVKEYIAPEMRSIFQAGMSSAFNDMANTADILGGGPLGEGMEELTKNRAALFKQMAAITQREHCFDDAYWYALDKTDFFPRPSQWEKLFSKVECRKMMDEWNAAVDEYIRTDGRSRDPFTVEFEAKIGMDGSPLYKTCSDEDCGKVEKRDVPALMKCSGCRRAFYCSTDCQKRSWKGHKKDCKAGTVQPQQSTSQWNLEGLAITMSAAHGVLAKGMS